MNGYLLVPDYYMDKSIQIIFDRFGKKRKKPKILDRQKELKTRIAKFKTELDKLGIIYTEIKGKFGELSKIYNLPETPYKADQDILLVTYRDKKQRIQID